MTNVPFSSETPPAARTRSGGEWEVMRSCAPLSGLPVAPSSTLPRIEAVVKSMSSVVLPRTSCASTCSVSCCLPVTEIRYEPSSRPAME
jgi:hypothetical protein